MAVPEQQMQHSLRIGDVILLYSKEGRGHVFSETSSSAHLTLSVLQEPDNSDIPDIRMAAFKILAQNKSGAQERFANLQRRMPHDGTATGKMELQNAEKNANIEIKSNEVEQERQKGTRVLYGSVIQLQHVYSKKYVAINTVQISKTENTNLQMYLLEQDSKNCLFKILPRYKVRSVGDEVRMEDQVIFASEKTEGQYIHTSSRTFHEVGITLHKNNYEINASATESGYIIKSHYRAMPKEQESVKGGSIIRLFHRELECYLVAEGSFANDDDKVVVEEVHLRKRKSDHGKLKAPSTSSITYWQIEKDEEPLSGQVVSWGERCRIKHLPTRLYLAIIKEESNHKVILKQRDVSPAKTDLDTVFRLFPVIEEDSEIQLDSYARINHPHTKTWLVAQKGEHYDRKAFKPDATGMASLQWDSAELLQIGIQDHMSYDDAFTIEKIDEELIKKFTFVAGVVPIIKAYIKELNSNLEKISVKKVDAIRKVLEELSDFVKGAHPRMKDHQKLLRNLMVLEMVMSILEKFDPDSQHASIHRPVCQACYDLIKVYLLGQSRKNENYLARFIRFFERQVGWDLNAEQMLTELVRDNALIISKFGDDEVDNIIDKLLKTKDPRFFDYLGVLCVCINRPIPKNQDSIIEKLVKQHGNDLFYLTEVRKIAPDVSSDTSSNEDDKKRKEIYYHTPNDSANEWHQLTKIAAKNPLEENPAEGKKIQHQYQYLVAQLDLFGKLCKGNNASAVETIDVKLKYLTFEEALIGAQDSDLHPALRSKYVELIVVLYIDVGDNRAFLDSLPLSFVYAKVSKNPNQSSAKDNTIALTGAKNSNFPTLKKWIYSHVTSIQSVVACESTIAENNLNAEVLGVLYLLVKFGYYDNFKDINELIPSLMSLLNGKNDKPFPRANEDESISFRKTERFIDNDKNKAVFSVKIKALKVMDLFFNFRFYLRLQHFIYDYKLVRKNVDLNEALECNPNANNPELTGRPAQQTVHHRHFSMRSATFVAQRVVNHLPLPGNRGNIDYTTEPPEQLQDLETNSHQLEINKNKELMQLAVLRLKQIFSRSIYKCDFVDSSGEKISFPEILIDLSQYDNDELLHESLHLLGRIFSAEENLFEKAIQTQLLITPESESICDDVLAKLPRLRHYAQIDVMEKQYLELVEILNTFTSLCHLEGDVNQPHKQNQKILYNTGVFSDVLNLIFQDKSSCQITSDGVKVVGNVDLKSDKMQQREDILSKCLQFLRLLARDNITVQERLFDRMDDLLQLDVAIPEMADLLSEVFTGGQEICLKIKERQVEQVFILIACDRIEGRAELLGMLQAVVKVEKLDLPLKRNQAYIIKYFSKTRNKFCNDLLGLEEDKEKKRMQLLIHAESSDPALQMLLKVIDLLASCSEGENLFIESICQNVLGISELLKILSTHQLDPIRKKPFVRFLLWVYMKTGGDKIQTGSTLLFHDWQMWSYMEHTSLVLEGVVKALNALDKSEATSAKSNLTSRSVRTRRNKQGMLVRRRTKTMCGAILYVTDKDGELIPGLLIYLMEGIMPMLKVYYSNYFMPHDTSAKTAGDSSERASPDKQIQISAAIASSLLYLADAIRNKNLLTSQEQWELLHTTIITIIRLPYLKGVLNKIDPKVRQRFDKSVKDGFTASNDTLKRYKGTYDQENLLNDEFNNFVRNYELAYWGPNTAAHQIGSPYENTYSEFEDDFLDEKGDEWLPLGKSFQDHVKLYIEHGHFSEVKVKPYVKRIIDCLESSYNSLAKLDEKERQRQDRNDIRYLHLLRTIIHNQVKYYIDPTLREEGQNPTRFRKQFETVESVQNQIQELGNTAERIVKLLAHPNDKISAEVLAFLSMLLYSGNTKVQKGFDYLMQTREDKLFVSMQQRLQQAAMNDCERRALLAQLESHKGLQEMLQSANVTETSPQHTVQRVLSPDSGVHDSTDTPLCKGRKFSSLSERTILSDEAFEMDTIQEYDASGPPLTDTHKSNYIAATRKKKRSDQYSDTDVNDVWSLERPQDKCSKRHSTDDDKKANSLKFKDTSYIELALRVLGLMCDGQYRPLQNYLRQQPDNIKNINLVSETCIFLSSFYVDVTSDNIVLINTALKTLIEMSVGNFANQQEIFNHQIIDIINRICQTVAVMQCPRTKVLELKQSAVELLEAMCEETHTGTEMLVQNIYRNVDIEALHKTLGYFYELSQDPEMKKQDKDDDAERATFRTYHVLVHMADFEGISMSDVEPKRCESVNDFVKSNDSIKKAWDYCKKWSKSIEVLYKNEEQDQKVLAKVHFRSYSSDELPDELIEKVKYRVNRDSPEDRTRDFLKWMKAVKRQMSHLTTLRKYWYTNMFVYNMKRRNHLLIFWTLLMNILLIIAWSDVDLKSSYVYSPPNDSGNDTVISHCLVTSCYNHITTNSSNVCDSSYCEMKTPVPTVPDSDKDFWFLHGHHWFFDFALYAGGIIHLLMSLGMVISYFLIHAANFVLPDFLINFLMYTGKPLLPGFIHKYIPQKKRNPTYSDEPLFGIRPLYHIVFLACSALSLSFYGYFYCICLLHIVIDNEILQRVLRSVTKNVHSLLWVGALGLVVLYIYSVGTFAFLRNEFDVPDPEEDGDNVRFCGSIIQCFISVMEYGLLDTLGLTADLPMNFKDAAFRAVFFDLTFFIIVTTIGLNIVFGIIVDTFSELRDEKWRIDEDKKDKCFICSLASYEFARRAEGFDHHVKEEHCMWDYIYYYNHLEKIDINDHNAIDSYVYQQIKSKKTDFFPLFRAKSLKPRSDEALTELKDLKRMVTTIMERFEHEEKAATLRRKREEQAQWEKDHTIVEDQ